MKNKTRLIQLEFYTDYDTPSDFLIIAEVVNNVPKSFYSVRVPAPFTKYPRFPFIKN